MSDSENARRGAGPIRHHRSRRALLKKLAAGAGVASVGRALPESWTKPIVDHVLLPVHAQASGGGSVSLTGNVVLGDDAPGGLAGIGPGNSSFDRPAGDDGTSVVLTATVTPPQAVLVSLAFDTAGGTLDAQDSIPASVMSDPGTGIANFGSFTANDLLDGDADGDAAGGTITNITAAFSVGAVNSVVSIDFT